MRAAGDTHNFGRAVRVRDEHVHKPRTVLWEQLFIGEESPLLAQLDEAAARDGLAGAFAFVPRLRYFGHGKVERLRLRPLRATSVDAKRALARVVGRALGLWSWFGVSDLHWENLALGTRKDGSIVFGPLDVETVLGDFRLPTETKLLPTADADVVETCRHAAGVRRVLPFLGKPVPASHVVAIAAAYRETLDFLDRHARALAQVLERTPGLRRAPIRVMLRGTDDYVRARSQPVVFPPLIPAEVVQMRRGDIPYFFQRVGEPAVRYFRDRALGRSAAAHVRGARTLSLSRGLRAPSRKTLKEQGLLVVLAAFDHAGLKGRHDDETGFAVRFGVRTLTVTLPTGEEIRAPRDLRGVVASVYLPCRCGEVRTVLA